MKNKVTKWLSMAALALGLWSARAGDQIIFIPYDSAHYDGSHYWSNVLYPGSLNVVTQWQGWQAANSNFVFLANGGGTNKGSSFSFGQLVATDSGSNYVVDLSGKSFQKVVASNDVNFVCMTNPPGSVEIEIWPNGTNRVLSFPTNWAWSGVGSFGVTGGLYQVVLTNGLSKVAQLQVISAAADQTNAVARFWIGR